MGVWRGEIRYRNPVLKGPNLMFEKITKSAPKPVVAKRIELPLTIAFLSCVMTEGFRLSYAALTFAARSFGEDVSTQIPAQRGAVLVKSLPVTLQPFVCRKSGKYGKGVLAQFESCPSDLQERVVIDLGIVSAALEEYAAE